MSHVVFIARGPRGALRIGRTRVVPVGSGVGADAEGARRPADHSQRLVYYEFYPTLGDAIHRERQLRTWQRRWKVELVESVNPHWDDLSPMLAA
ncbi:MAG TPA: GIY-YIG nuclease family protein [Bauldia sp.]|nr:GIY-YIG nuclease family protein [Bauldia sp.]